MGKGERVGGGFVSGYGRVISIFRSGAKRKPN